MRDFKGMSTHLGYLTIKENNIRGSSQGVFLLSSSSPGHVYDIHGNGIYLYSIGFRESVSLFLVRTIVRSDWIVGSDVYASPS